MSYHLSEDKAHELVMNFIAGYSVRRACPQGVSKRTAETYRQTLINHGVPISELPRQYLTHGVALVQEVGLCKCGCGQRTTRLVYDDKITGKKAGDFKDYIHGHWVRVAGKKKKWTGEKAKRIRDRELARAKISEAVAQNPLLTIEDLRTTIAPDFNNWAISRMLNVARGYADEGVAISAVDPNNRKAAFLPSGRIVAVRKKPVTLAPRFTVPKPVKLREYIRPYPKEFRIKRVWMPIADCYPFVSSNAARSPDHELLLAVNALVPEELSPDVREEVCQDILLAILEGKTTIEKVGYDVQQYVKSHYKFMPKKFGHVSLDASAFGELDGRTAYEVICDRGIDPTWDNAVKTPLEILIDKEEHALRWSERLAREQRIEEFERFVLEHKVL